MVTAVHDISVALAAIRYGAYDYLLKPFEREQLLAVVRRALEANRLRVQNRVYQINLESLVNQRTKELRNTIAELEHSYAENKSTMTACQTLAQSPSATPHAASAPTTPPSPLHQNLEHIPAPSHPLHLGLPR